ncbi:hypothetical protein R50073_24370 [Maricurvus nonylphenolicus]|uniref:phage regulatory CII family protein n=1 Tax=Maricurvus nonylphenolicus TaxID=1008307 RepID=UPI0036F243B2
MSICLPIHAERSIEEVQRAIVLEFKPGLKKLAIKAGVSGPGILSNKVNPAQPHQLSVIEAVRVQKVTGDYRLLRAEAAALNHGIVPLTEHLLGASDTELLGLWADCIREEGETAREIQAALEDGEISADEYQRIERETFEDITAKLALLERLRTLMVEETQAEEECC